MSSKTTSEDALTREQAIKDLEGLSGSEVLYAKDARAIAAAFDVELHERVGELEPLKHLLRGRTSETLGISVGALCYTLADRLEGIEAEEGAGTGHARYSREQKKRNLPALKTLIDE